MASILQTSYFIVLTITQEIALAKDVSMSYNGYELQWDFFKEAMVMRAVLLLEKEEGLATLFDVLVLQLIAMRKNLKKE
ncbi:uncharacterized protein N7483_003485 [Penicillium malachiteum]|uniref:uncharacterized protein n=1 Tax=Penicillium malachiteum TaxID=1324776 RepID=UPI00254894B4|nr:uncharacterized protein N7483_003485 [Penicillium malachiteum]KAJ5728977.1 hypothetical protein N7483_003485 [Penicillium malachiteum]